MIELDKNGNFFIIVYPIKLCCWNKPLIRHAQKKTKKKNIEAMQLPINWDNKFWLPQLITPKSLIEATKTYPNW